MCSYTVPLVVDLDLTLIPFDSSRRELLLAFLRPCLFIQVCFCYIFKGIAEVKYLLARTSLFLAAHKDFLFNPELLALLNKLPKNRPLWLLTGANYLYAEQALLQLPIFHRHQASERWQNVTVVTKLDWLKSQKVDQYDYAGDRWADYSLFQLARVAYIVNPSWALCFRLFCTPLPNAVYLDVRPWKFFLLPKVR